jgi:hypothetical protein
MRTCVFYQDKTIFVSPNAESLPSHIPKEDDPIFLSAHPERVLLTNWAQPDLPHLAFVLDPPPLEANQLLMRLNHLGIHRCPGGFALQDENRDSWQSLENCVTYCCNALFGEAMTKRRASFPLDFSSSTTKYLPYQYGYRRIHRTYEIAYRCARKARFAFYLLFGLLSYAITLNQDFPGDRRWLSVLLEERHGVHPAWLNDIASSPIADFSGMFPRVGAFISPKVAPQLKSSFPNMISGRCPIYIHWDHPDWYGDKDSHQIKKYAPRKEDVLSAMRPITYATLPSLADFHTPEEIDRMCSQETPTAFNDTAKQPERQPRRQLESQEGRPSGQLQGETMDQFFDRRDKRHARQIQNQTPKQKQQRESRSKAAENHPRPGKQGAAVFVWDDDDQPGVLVRRSICRGRVEDIFDTYGPSQRRYNPIDNEWDIYEGWDSFAISDADQQQDYDDFADPTPVGPPPPTPPPTLPPSPGSLPAIALSTSPAAVGSVSFADDLQQVYASSADPATGLIDIEAFEELEDTIYYRYGFSWNIEDDYSSINQAVTAKDIDIIKKLLVDRHCSLRYGLHQPLTDFMQQLVHYGQHKSQSISLQSLWDLSAANPNRLPHGPNQFLRITPRDFGGRTLYFISSVHSAAPAIMQVAVDSAATALECYRRSWTTPDDVVRHLLETGKSFRTYIPRSPPPMLVRPTHVSLGYRDKNYIFDQMDYRAYEERRDLFFKQPHARAALLKGGIIWRLAMESIGPDVAIMGPSEGAHHFGDIVGPDGHQITDDDLTIDELNLICGVYEVPTGNNFFYISPSFL